MFMDPSEEIFKEDGRPSCYSLEIDKIGAIYQCLSALFPDAETSYLDRLSLEYGPNTKDLDLVIERLMKFKNYPKEKDKNKYELSKVKWIPVEEFVTKFPQPEEYFKRRTDGKEFSAFSLRYLRDKFKRISGPMICQVFTRNNSNLTLSKIELDSIQPNLSCDRNPNEMWPYLHCPNNKFHDEVYFLEYQEEITWFLNEREKISKLDEEKLKEGQFLCCQCCFNEEVLLEDIVTCREGHVFCRGCVKRGSEIAFGDGKIQFNCLSDCTSEFSLESLRGILPDIIIEKFMSRVQEWEIKSAKIPGLYCCPFCDFAVILPDNEMDFHCEKCEKIMCRYCHGEPHKPLTCEEVKDKKSTSARVKIEDKMTEALLRECYRCSKKFFKQDGCNKMVCTCGAIMCYICRKPIADYSHFAQQKDSTSGKCPLWSNNNNLHQAAVTQAAVEGVAELGEENSELKIESSQLLKGLN